MVVLELEIIQCKNYVALSKINFDMLHMRGCVTWMASFDGKTKPEMSTWLKLLFVKQLTVFLNYVHRLRSQVRSLIIESLKPSKLTGIRKFKLLRRIFGVTDYRSNSFLFFFFKKGDTNRVYKQGYTSRSI